MALVQVERRRNLVETVVRFLLSLFLLLRALSSATDMVAFD